MLYTFYFISDNSSDEKKIIDVNFIRPRYIFFTKILYIVLECKEFFNCNEVLKYLDLRKKYDVNFIRQIIEINGSIHGSFYVKWVY